MTDRPIAPDWLAEAQGARRRDGAGAGGRSGGRVAESATVWPGSRDCATCALDEVLRFEGGQFGFAQVLDPDLIGCRDARRRDRGRGGRPACDTGEVVSVPVGEALLGRIVDPLGRPLDGKGRRSRPKSAGRSSARRRRSSNAIS